MSDRREIVVGVDGSPGSAAAVRWAAQEAAVRGSGLLIIHAVDAHAYGLWTTTRVVREGLRDLARPYVDSAAALAQSSAPGVPVRTRVMVASTTRVLILLSRTADLTVLGKSGRTALARFMLGSVVERVLANAAGPVVAVPAQADATAPIPLDRVVAAIDDPDRHRRTLSFAFAEALRHRVGVHIVHVPDIDSTPRDLYPISWIGEWREAFPGVPVTYAAAGGPLLEAIGMEANESDLMVIGHHRGSLAPCVLGRHGRSLFRHAEGPVAVVGEPVEYSAAEEADLLTQAGSRW